MRRREKHILFIQGVFDSRCNINSIIDEKYNSENIDYDIPENKGWDTIPSKFTNKKSWPSGLNVLCGTCSMSCEDHYLSIPLVYKKPVTPDKYNIIMHKAFNSWPCMVYYVKNHMNNNNLESNIIKFYKILTGIKRTTTILPCSDPTTMVQYGGNLTSEEWIKINSEKDSEYDEYVNNIPKTVTNVPDKTSTNTEQTLLDNNDVIEKLY